MAKKIPASLLTPVSASPTPALEQQASVTAASQYAPARKQLQGQKKVAKSTFRQTKAANRGAARLMTAAISKAEKEILTKSPELAGSEELRQIVQEYAARKIDAHAFASFSTKGARSDLTTNLGKINNDIATNRSQQAAKGSEILQGLIKDQTSALQSTQGKLLSDSLERRRSAISAARSATTKAASSTTGYKNAVITAHSLLAGVAQAQNQPAANGKPPPPLPSTDADWAQFALEVATRADGADQQDAVKAVNALRKQLAKGNRPVTKLNPFA